MGNFTTDWDESTVADTSQASTLGAVDRANQVNLSDRLKALIYGFVNGENDGVPGCKNLAFKQQSGDPTVAVDTITLYAKDVGGNNEVFFDDETGNGPTQITNAGALGAGGISLLAGKDLIGSATSDITMNTDKFTVAGDTGNTVVAGTLGVTGIATLGDGSLATTQSAADNSTKLATTAYADRKEATLVTQATASIFGPRTFNNTVAGALVHTTIYQAQCDGFLTISNDGGTGDSFIIYTDSDATPDVAVAEIVFDSNIDNGVTIPILKDDYVQVARVVGSTAIDYMSWVPIGTGGLVAQ